jgi:hypothetical protein
MSTVATMIRLERIARAVADVAAERAARRATTLPMLAQFAGTALATEVRLQADEIDRVFAAAGLARRSVLHSVAARVPDATTCAARVVVDLDRGAATLLHRAANWVAAAPDAAAPVVE